MQHITDTSRSTSRVLCSATISCLLLVGCNSLPEKSSSVFRASLQDMRSTKDLNLLDRQAQAVPLAESPLVIHGAMGEDDPIARSRTIAKDFVATLATVPQFSSPSLVLYTRKPSTRFGAILITVMQQSGFDLRIGTSGPDKWFDYHALQNATSEGQKPVFTFLVAVGSMKLKRSYKVDQSGVVPVGEMLSHGTAVSGS